MTTCPKCGAENKPESNVCRMCATPLGAVTVASSPTEAPCPKCGAVNEAGWAFCLQCGAKLHQAAQEFVEAIPEAPPPEARRSSSRPTAVEAEVPPHPPPQAPPEPPSERQVPPTGERTQAAVTTTTSPGAPCPQCRSMNDLESSFCFSCGSPLRGSAQAQTRVMSSVAPPRPGRLHLIMEGGQAGEVFDLKDETVIGRTDGDISFAHDGFMSGRHARIVRRSGKFVLKDEGSRNGTYIRIEGEVELKPGDMILIGKQVFRFET